MPDAGVAVAQDNAGGALQLGELAGDALCLCRVVVLGERLTLILARDDPSALSIRFDMDVRCAHGPSVNWIASEALPPRAGSARLDRADRNAGLRASDARALEGIDQMAESVLDLRADQPGVRARRAARVSALHSLVLQEPRHVGENLEGRLETRQCRPKADGSARARRGGSQRPRAGEKPTRMLEQLVRPFGVGFTSLVSGIGASL
jgi:hypothetical protein